MVRVFPNQKVFKHFMEVNNMTKKEFCKYCNIAESEVDEFEINGRILINTLYDIIDKTGLKLEDIFCRIPILEELDEKKDNR